MIPIEAVVIQPTIFLEQELSDSAIRHVLMPPSPLSLGAELATWVFVQYYSSENEFGLSTHCDPA
jgi:hypothetical protein